MQHIEEQASIRVMRLVSFLRIRSARHHLGIMREYTEQLGLAPVCAD
ncbi:MAG: hypothetical protein IPN96_18785 [Anaerolineales bacterium]|nr:hypothetical protein [Anaerolineales bacterium]